MATSRFFSPPRPRVVLSVGAVKLGTAELIMRRDGLGFREYQFRMNAMFDIE